MKDIPEQKYRELIKGIEATAHNQGLFFKLHSGIFSMMSFSEKAGGVDSKTVGGIAAPETQIERYSYYLACLNSLIDNEKQLGGEFSKQCQELSEAKQAFLKLVKSIKDDESARGISSTGRIFTWHELQNDLQLSISQRTTELQNAQSGSSSATNTLFYEVRHKRARSNSISALETSFDRSMNVGLREETDFGKIKMLPKRKRADLSPIREEGPSRRNTLLDFELEGYSNEQVSRR